MTARRSTNPNGVEDDGETFQFTVSHAATAVDANNDTFNDGDADFDGQLDVGETWQYTVAYTVTQDDIDNGGVVDPGLTHDNTATATTAQGAGGEAVASVDIEQNPHVTLVKTASVPGGTADAAGEVISYAITIKNDGNMTLTNPVVSDPSVSGLAAVMSGAFNAGDADTDGKLDVGETWQYTASHTVTQADIDNTATVTTTQGAGDDDSASVAIDQNPHVTLEKAASVPGGTADAGEVISYAITIENDGNMTLTDPAVSDPSVSNLAAVMSGSFNAGDADMDGVFDVGELWQYAASHTVTQAEFNAGGNITNTASVTTNEGASDSDSASVAVNFTPHAVITLTKSALGYHDLDNNGLDAGDTVDFQFLVSNEGNVTLHNIGVVDVDSNVVVTGAPFDLAPGASNSTSWVGVYTITVVADEASDSSGTVHVLLAGLTEL